MAYYWCWDTTNFALLDAYPSVTESNFSVKPTFNGKSFTSNGVYRSSANTITKFRDTQTFIFETGANLTQKNNIHIYSTTTVSFYDNQILTLNNDITNDCAIMVIDDTTIEITPLDTVSGNNLTLVIDFNNELSSIKVHITGNIVNASCNYVDGEVIDVNKDIIITANAGYTFKGVFNYAEGTITKPTDNQKTHLIIETSNINDTIYLNDNYIATKEVEQLGSFVNLYKTNQTELTALSKVRFYENAGQIIDYGQFINSLYILPFDIPSDILGDKSTILLGNFDSKVESTLISTYIFDFNGGEIEVPLKYNNIYDYINTECILHLPFLDKVYLNTEYVIGQKLTITFTIELYSGTLTANIKSSFNNEIVASVQGLISMNIPFIQNSNGNVINSISNVYKNKNNRCFIEVNRNIPYIKDNNDFRGSVVEYGRIGDYTGYLECDKIVLETNATNQEQEEIKDLLKNGVFLNGNN